MTATFSLTGDLEPTVSGAPATPRSAYVELDRPVADVTNDVSYAMKDRTTVGPEFTLSGLPAKDALNNGGSDFNMVVTIGARKWVVAAQAAGSTWDLSSFPETTGMSLSIDASMVTAAQAAATAAAASATAAGNAAASVVREQAGGVAGLDGSGKLILSRFPTSLAREAANGVAGLDASGKLYETRIPTRLGDTALETKYARTANRPINLREAAPTIDFTGATDSRAALQSALTAAGGARVELGREGVIRCDTGLVLPEFQTIVGAGQFLGVGGTAPSEITFANATGTMTGITGGGNNVIEDLLIRGPGAAVASKVGFASVAGSPRFYRVGWVAWEIGSKISNAYYTTFVLCQWSRNMYALVNSGNYNLTLDTPMFYCSYGSADSLHGYAIDGAARGMTIKGGSIEGYTSGIQMYSLQQLDTDGVYFETVAGASAIAISAAGYDGVTLNLRGGTVYLAEHTRFVHLSGSTNVVINSEGHKFVCGTGSATVPTAYYFESADVPNIKGRLGYDDWTEMAKVGSAYITPGPLGLGQTPNLDIRVPGLKYLSGDRAGTGTPEGVVPGPIGAIYRRLDGGAATSIYVKQSGSGTVNGWIGK